VLKIDTFAKPKTVGGNAKKISEKGTVNTKIIKK
jgi:hypothetical protein